MTPDLQLCCSASAPAEFCPHNCVDNFLASRLTGTFVRNVKTQTSEFCASVSDRSALCSWLLTSGPTLFCICKPFLFKACFPDMPCVKRVYRDKKASVHRSAARNKERFSYRFKQLTNRLQIAYQPVIWFPHSFKIGFCFFVLLKRRSGDVSSMLWGYEGCLSPGRTVLSASRPAQPCPAAPPCAPTRPGRGMFGFWNRQVVIYNSIKISVYEFYFKH